MKWDEGGCHRLTATAHVCPTSSQSVYSGRNGYSLVSVLFIGLLPREIQGYSELLTLEWRPMCLQVKHHNEEVEQTNKTFASSKPEDPAADTVRLPDVQLSHAYVYEFPAPCFCMHLQNKIIWKWIFQKLHLFLRNQTVALLAVWPSCDRVPPIEKTVVLTEPFLQSWL